MIEKKTIFTTVQNCQLLKQLVCRTTCPKALGRGVAPELIKLCNFVKDGVDDDEAEVAVIDLSLEALQETYLVRRFHCIIVIVLHHLSQVFTGDIYTLHKTQFQCLFNRLLCHRSLQLRLECQSSLK